MILAVLSATATVERELMLERQAIGIATSKAAGKYKEKQVNPRAVKACERTVGLLASSGMTKQEAASAAGVTTLNRYLKLAA